MKRYVLFLLFVMSLTLWGQQYGDVNNDNTVNIVDALMTAQYYVGLEPQGFSSLSGEVSGDGMITIVDALQIAQYYVGLIDHFPVEDQQPTPTPLPVTLVVNGDFETGVFDPWSIWNGARIGDWKAHSGNYCAAVGAKSPASIEQTVSLEPSMVYELSGWLLADNEGDQVRLGVKDYGGTETYSTVSTKSWQFRTVRFITPEHSSSARIYLFKASGTGWGYGDDIQITRIGPYSGGPLPPALPGNWQLVFQDDFEGNSLDRSKWSTDYPWGHTHNHRGYTNSGNVIVEQGLLRLKAENRRHPDAPDGINRDDFGWLSLDYTTGCVTTSGKYHFNHGYMEARLKLPGTRGFWPAFWTLGDGWPPEIDIMEFLSSEPARYYTNFHWGDPSYGSYFKEHWGEDLTRDFHVFAVEWDSSHMTWYFDGSEIARYTGDKCPQAVNQYILLNLAIGGWEEDPDSSTVWPGWYDCDWVRVWQK